MSFNSYRNIIKTGEFDRFFSAPKGRTIIVNKWAFVDDTMGLMKRQLPKTLHQTKAIAKYLKGNSIHETCERIWNFCYHYFQYKKDKKGKEQVRSPARCYHDRKTGIDCDCFSNLIASIAQNLNMKWTWRLIKRNYQNYYSHIYVVVFDRGKEIIIDPVLHNFNQEADHTEKKDITMELQYLDGLDGHAEVRYDGIDASDLLDADYQMTGLRDAFNSIKEKVTETAQKVADKVGPAVTNTIHTVNRANPTYTLLRAGVIASMKLNLMQVATRLRYAYLSPTEAAKRGFNAGAHNKYREILKRAEQIFFKAGGKPENLRSAILGGKGNADRAVPLNGLAGLGELGEIATATAIGTATATMASLAALLNSAGELKRGISKLKAEPAPKEAQQRPLPVDQNLNIPFRNRSGAGTGTTSVDSFSDFDLTRSADAETPPEDTEPGFFQRAGTWIKENPLTATLTGVGVAAGGYWAYTKIRDKVKAKKEAEEKAKKTTKSKTKSKAAMNGLEGLDGKKKGKRKAATSKSQKGRKATPKKLKATRDQNGKLIISTV